MADSTADSMIVNGQSHAVPTVGEQPLLWTLRDQLGLLSPKYGCGLEQCGACVVLIDGIAEPSCQRPARTVAGHEVQTLEGLRDDPVAQRVIGALAAANAGQCGYCLPGITIRLIWLLRRAPVEWDFVLASLDDHLCRCGSQPRILRVARALLSAETCTAPIPLQDQGDELPNP
jgi:aerobic-type carbon monoxide dehydrogenase small subunit (CoxS/CutS family)